MKNTVLILMMVTAIAAGYSCKKKKSDPPPTPPQNFQPTSTGSTWSYSSISNGAPAVNYTLTSTGNDSLINGTAYKIFTNSGGPNEYYNKTGNDYSRYSFFQALNQAVELLYLKENYNVGQKWTQRKNGTINGVAVTADLDCEVVEKNINYTVNGKTFSEVTHLKINPAFFAFGNQINTNKAEIHYYFANNVGYIYSSTDLAISLFGVSYAFVGTVTLTAYNIK